MKGLISERELLRVLLLESHYKTQIIHIEFKNGIMYESLYFADGAWDANSEEAQKEFLREKANELRKEGGYVSLSSDGTLLEWSEDKNIIKHSQSLKIIPFI